jgi:CRISPR/Cas system type I-B associated protein Csh2 (Cas7 group RAMP superfamily)
VPALDECTRCTPLFPLSERTDEQSKRVWAGLPLSVRSSADRLSGSSQTRFIYAADQIIQDFRDANNRFWEQYGDEQVSQDEFLKACQADQSRALMRAKLKDLLAELGL